MPQNKLVVAWLRDAHSMEEALEDFINKAHGDFADDSASQTQLEQLAGQSRQAREELTARLEEIDEKPSGGKDLLGKVIGFASGLGASMYRDDAIKDLLVLHGVFHFAHASYISLAHAASVSGDEALAATCERLAGEREEAANWASEHVPAVTEQILSAQDES